jgi:hypothetical protein
MKIHTFFFRKMILLFIIFISYTLNSFAQRELHTTFEDGNSTTIIFEDEDPENIAKWNLSFRIFGLRLMRNTDPSDGNLEVAGPFFLDLDFQHFLFEKKGLINARVSYTPIDSRYLNKTSGLRKSFFFAEAVYTHEFKSFNSFKKRRLNFTDGSGYYSGTRYVTKYYKLKTEVLQKRSFGIRGGMHWYQYSLKRTKYHEEISKIYGGDLMMFILGVSSTRTLNLQYNSSDFGSQKLFGMWSLYLDFLYSPYVNLYTGYRNGDNVPITEKIDNSRLDINPFGVRFGGYRKISMVHWNLATIYSFEIGSLPSADKELYFTIGIGLVFGDFKKS